VRLSTLLLAGLVALACACGGAAVQQRKVAFLGVEKASGKPDRTYESWVAERVERDYDVVMVDDGLPEEITEKAMRKVAKRTGTDAVLYGELSKKKKGRMWLTVLVHDGQTGELIETHEISIKKGKVNSKHERRFARTILASLPPPPVEEPPPPKKEKATKIAKPEKEPEPEAEPEPEPEVEMEPEPEPEPVAKAPKKSKSSKPSKPVFEAADDADKVKFDGSGQALDDEMPDSLKK
jgi:hypothetical protein